MKRLTAWLLIAGLLVSNATSVQASSISYDDLRPNSETTTEQSDSDLTKQWGATTDNTESTDTTTQKGRTAQPQDDGGTDWDAFYAPENGTGGIELTIGNTLPLESAVEFRVTVATANGEKQQEETLLFDVGDTQQTVTFKGLPSGTYRITVTADGFVDYTQEITVQGTVESASIYSSVLNLEGVDYEEGSAHPGVFLIGDVDGDGKITEADRDIIIDIASGILSGDIDASRADLNGDGEVDILDLQYFTTSWKQMDQIDTQAAVAGRVSEGAVAVQAGTGTQVTGNAGDLLNGESSVTLGTQDGAAISEDNPVEIGVALQSQSQEASGECTQIEEINITTGENGIQSGEVIIVTDENEEESIQIADGKVVNAARIAAGDTDVQNTQDDEQVLKISLGGKVAVKRVVIRVTAAKGSQNLVDISKVEFLNDMENRIPEPEMDIPQNLAFRGADKSFTLTWDESNNVTGYEVEITHDGVTEVIRTAVNMLRVTSFAGKELVNQQVYAVRVQAINGNWKSGYTDAIQAMPKIEACPSAPDYVSATGAFRKIQVSWKKMDDTTSYYVYYREKGADTYERSEAITEASYEITGLKDKTTYEIYVTGENELGESVPSLTAEATTTFVQPVVMPKYKLINTSNGEGELTQHIVSATRTRGSMEDSVLDEGSSSSALGLVDDDFGSYYKLEDWDDGAGYPSADKGVYITFDQSYTMNYITFADVEDVRFYYNAAVYYYDADHKTDHPATVTGIVQKTDENGRKYYAIKLKDPITADKIRVCVSTYKEISIAEMRFYYYDSLEDDVMALYADDLHTQLKSDVDAETIEKLQTRLDTVDTDSGEYHPEREAIQKELDNAKGILETKTLGETINISSKITAAKDSHLGIGGLNAWQPLGVSAYAGEQVVIYVGHNSRKAGDNASLKLIATQYDAESSNVGKEIATLKVGRNEVTIPKLQSIAGAESGGALYIQYTGNNESDQYAVRVSGGVEIPVLNLYGVTDAAERFAKVSAYVRELDTYVGNMENIHTTYHEVGEAGTGANCDYAAETCIAGATDIVLDQMMYSVSVLQIYKALGAGSTHDRAAALNDSLTAMDEMMELFYQHKGLTSDSSAKATDQMPSQHLNIRYMRMFAGAFMYAAGNHIGIGWNSVSGLASAEPIVSNDGKYISGSLFGWGIAHEIGHNINQKVYEVAEITNNYFAQLTTARDTNESVRFDYDDVYAKVTSNTVGSSDNQATQLAMYWQLHLAYDRGYNFKIYESYEDQFDNLFYARVDTYARDVSRAPAPDGVKLTLEGDKDQIFMRLAAAAAQKDLTEYFTRWGMVPNEGTLAYMQQFEKEERAIYYINDNARVYEIEHGVKDSIEGADVIVASGSIVTVNSTVPNEVELTIQSNVSADVLLGYEVIRCTYEGGEATRQVVGFASAESGGSTHKWKDYVSTMNNRVVTYEVRAVDKYGYYSEVKEIGSVRISHDGSLDKTMWTAQTNMTSQDDAAEGGTQDDPCEPTTKSAVSRVIDNDYSGNTYVGKADNDAYVTLAMKQSHAVSALKYTVAEGTGIKDFVIEVSEDGTEWTVVREGAFEEKTGSQIVYFQNADKDPWVATYDAAYVRLTAKGTAGTEVAITELDVLGPTGDNIHFGVVTGGKEVGVGILQADYEYAAGEKIPAGSLVFMGSYKGNPAYNTVLVYDEDGEIVGGQAADGSIEAEQIILADVPEQGLLGEVSDGIWIYWIAPDADGKIPSISGKVRAELYRVDNAQTNEGQRLVSDTLPLEIPETLEEITLEAE